MERYFFFLSFFFRRPSVTSSMRGSVAWRAYAHAHASFPRFCALGESDSQIHPFPEVIGQGSHEHAFSMHSREGYSTRADLVRKQRGVTGSRWLVHEAPLHHLLRLPACTRGPTARSLLQPLRGSRGFSQPCTIVETLSSSWTIPDTHSHARSLPLFLFHVFSPLHFSSRFRRKKKCFFFFSLSLSMVYFE